MELKLPPIASSVLLLLLLQRNAVAGPLAVPEPAPAPEAASLPLAAPEAIANAWSAPELAPLPAAEAAAVARAADDAMPIPDLDRRGSYHYYPFSGAIYIVASDGSTITSSSGAQCPDQEPAGCGSINAYNWCCPLGNSCAWLSNSVVGCCPGGSTCGGTVAADQIQTVTVGVAAATTSTTSQQVASTVIEVGTSTSTTIKGIYVTVVSVQTITTTVNGIYVTEVATITVTQTSPYNVVTTTGVNNVVTTTSRNQIINNGPYCSTLVAKGPGLPTTAQGQCGTILVINAADIRHVGWRLPALITGVYGALGLYSAFGFRRQRK